MTTYRLSINYIAKLILWQVLILVLANGVTSAYGQTYSMPAIDTLKIDATIITSGTITDDGGKGGDYSNGCNGYALITSCPGATMTLSGNVTTESCCDYLDIYTADGTTLLQKAKGTATVNLSTDEGGFLLYFYSDGSMTEEGFELAWSTNGLAEMCTGGITSFTASEIGATEATLSWTADKSSLILDYGNGEQVVGGSSTTLSGLNPSTLYTARLYASGEGSNPCCVRTVQFRTACGKMYAPLVERFDDLPVDTVPKCWVGKANYDSPELQPKVVANAAKSGKHSMQMSGGTKSSHFSIALAPVMSTEINTLRVHVSLRSNSYNAKIEVGVCDTTSEYQEYYGFTSVETLTVPTSGTWYDYTIDMSGYTGDGCRLAFRMPYNLQPVSSAIIYIDNVMAESCGVDSLRVSHLAYNEMTLHWTTINDPTVDLLVYGKDMYETYTNVTSPYTLTGLDPAGSYTMVLTPHCGSSYGTPKSITASTLTNDTLPIAYCESFPDPWPLGWQKAETNSYYPQHETYNGSCVALWSFNGLLSTVSLPRLVSSTEGLTLRLEMKTSSAGSGVVVGMMGYPLEMSTFEPIDTLMSPDNEKHRYEVDLGKYTGDGHYLALRSYSNNTFSQYMYLYEVKMGHCLVSNLTAKGSSASSVTIEWDSTASDKVDSVIVEYGKIGFTFGMGTRLSLLDETEGIVSNGNGRMAYTIEGLEAGETYDFVVYRDCGDLLCSPEKATCSPLLEDYTIPYCERFDSYANGSFPTDWHRPSTYNSCPYISTPYTDAPTANGVLRMASYGPVESGYDHSTAVLPVLEYDGSMSDLVVSFFAKGTYAVSELQVGVMSDPDDESTFTQVASVKVAYNEWRHHAVSLKDYVGVGTHIALRYSSACQWCNTSAYIDNLEVGLGAIDGVDMYSIRTTGADFSYDTVGTVGEVQLYIVDGTDTTKYTPTGNAISVSGLKPGVTYNYMFDYGGCNAVTGQMTTPTEALQSDWCYGFENNTNSYRPEGWGFPYTYNITSGDHHGGSRSLTMASRIGLPNLAVMPYLEEDDYDNLHFTFWAKNNNYNVTYVGLLKDPRDTVGFVILDTIGPADNVWRLYDVDLEGHENDGHHIAFFSMSNYQNCSGCDTYVDIDDLRLARGNIDSVSYTTTATTATVEWTSKGCVDSVHVTLTHPDLGAIVDSTVVNSQPGQMQIQDLQSNTIYTLRIESVCKNSFHSCSLEEYSVTTLEHDLNDGYCEDFSGQWDPLPVGWTYLENGGGIPTHPSYNSDVQRYSIGLPTSWADSSYTMLIAPPTTESINSLVVGFGGWESEYNAEQPARLVVGVIDNPSDASTFTAMDTILVNSYLEHWALDLSSYNGNGKHIAFKAQSIEGRYNTVYLTDITLSHCKPTAIHATELTTDSFTLRWTMLGPGDSIRIRYASIDTTVLATPAYVRLSIPAEKVGESLDIAAISTCQQMELNCQWQHLTIYPPSSPNALSQCLPFLNAPSSYQMDVTQMPYGWIRPYGNLDPITQGAFDHNVLLFSASSKGDGYDRSPMAVSPYFEDSLTDSHLHLHIFNISPGTYFEVGTIDDPYDSSTFVPHDTLSLYPIRTLVSLPLEAYKGHYIAFRYRALQGFDGNATLDELAIAPCAMPIAWLSHPEDSTVMVNWLGGGEVWIEYREGGDFVPGTGTRLLATSSPTLIEGLTPSSVHTFHIWPQCDTSSFYCNHRVLILSTLDPPLNLPYCNHFESPSTGNIPSGWSSLPDNTSVSTSISSGGYTDNQHLSLTPSADHSVTALLPNLKPEKGCTDSVYLNFWYRWNSSASVLLVGSLTDASDTASFITFDTLEFNDTYEWQHHTTTLPPTALTQGHVALRVPAGYPSVSVDNLCVEACMAANLQISEVGRNSVTITWEGYGVSALVCEYGLSGFAQGTGEVVHITSSPYTIDGLTSSSDYSFIFKTECTCSTAEGKIYTGGEGNGWGGNGGSVNIEVITQAEPVLTPYCEDFDTFDINVIPSKWRRIPGNPDDYPKLHNDPACSGARSLDMYTTPGYATFAALPPVEDPSQLVLSFMAYTTSTEPTVESYGVLTVGVMTNPDQGPTFSIIDTVVLGATKRWQQCFVDLSSYTGTGEYIALRLIPHNNAHHIYIDNLYLGSCMVTSASATVTDEGVEISYTTLGNANGVFLDWDGGSTTLTSSPSTVDALIPNEHYELQLRAFSSLDTQLICHMPPLVLGRMMRLPYCDNFDATTDRYPDGWGVVLSNDNTYSSYTNGVQDGAMFMYPSGTNTPVLFTLPTLSNGDTLGGKWVQLDYRHPIASSNTYVYTRLDIGYMTDTSLASTFVPLVTLQTNAANQSLRTQLPTSNATQLALRGRSTSSSRIFCIDNLLISTLPLPMASDIVASHTSSTNQTLTWNANPLATHYQYEYGPAGFTPGSGTTAQSDSCQIVLQDLVANSDYDLYFIDSTGTVSCQPYRFNTSRTVRPPYCEDFEGVEVNTIPAGWTRIGANEYPRVNNINSHVLEFRNNGTQVFVLPEPDIDSIQRLSLTATYMLSSSYNQMEIGVMTDPSDFATFVAIDTIARTGNSNTFVATTSFANYQGTGRYIALHYLYYSGYIYVDDVVLDDAPLVELAPTSASSFEIIASNTTTPDYYIEVCNPDQNQGNGAIHHVQDRTYTVHAPYMHRTYTVYVRTDSASSTCVPPQTVTLPVALGIPMCEEFDNQNAIPDNWSSYYTYYSNNVKPATNNNEKTIYLYSYYYDSSDVYVALPDLDVDDLSSLSIELRYRFEQKTGMAEIGFMHSPNGWSSFVPFDTLASISSTSWQTLRHDLINHSGNDRFLAIRMKGYYQQFDYLYIDYLHISPCPLVHFALASYNSILCSVDSAHTAVDYWVHLTSDGLDSLIHVTSNTYLIDGLAANQTYTLAAQCDKNAAGCNSTATITTGILKELPYCEQFDTYGTGNGSQPYGWFISTQCSGDRIYTTSSNNYSLYMESNYYNQCDLLAILPDFDIDSICHLSAQIRYQYTSHACPVQIGVMDNPYDPSSFVVVDTLKEATNTWFVDDIDFSSYTGNGRFVAIRMQGNYQYYKYLYIDYLNLRPIPLVELAQTGATSIHATTNPDISPDYWLHYTAVGSNDTVHVHVQTSDYTLSGLDENTAYSIVASHDSARTTCWQWKSFTTTHALDLPYCDDFKSYDYYTLPTGWQRYNTNNGSTPYINNDIYSKKSIYFYGNGTKTLVLPYIANLKSSTVHVQTSGRNLLLGVMSDASDPDSFVTIDTLKNETSNQYTMHSVGFDSYNGDGHFVAFRTSEYYSSYINRLSIVPCDNRAEITRVGSNVVQIDSPGDDTLVLEYGLKGFVQGTGTTIQLAQLPMTLELDFNTDYDFYIKCDSSSTCQLPTSITTLSEPMEIPLCEGFEGIDNNTIPSGWTTIFPNKDYGVRVGIGSSDAHSGSKLLAFEIYYNHYNILCLPEVANDSLRDLTLSFWFKSSGNGVFNVGVMSDPTDASTFIPISTITGTTTWSRKMVSMGKAPVTHHYIALRGNGQSGDIYAYIDDLHIAPCGAHHMVVKEIENESLTVDWEQTGNPTVELELVGGGITKTVSPVTSHPYVFDGLVPLTHYKVYMRSVCDSADDNCTNNIEDSASVFTPAGGTGCIDPTNLTADYTTCFVGTFNNPYSMVSCVDKGAADIMSRHTIHTDTSERDARTGYQLRTVAPGADASVRLGNWGHNYDSPEAEGISYALRVDTMEFDLLVLRYAAVLEDPFHDGSDQPRFKLELLDSNMNLIDPVCGAADFRANQNLGWEREGEEVLWKDWTTVGLDVSAYSGQTIYIRLTTYDCGEGSHFGYAYFTLDCHRKNMVSDTCGDVESNTFTAPSGFAYSWYTDQDTTVFSREQSVVVASDNDLTYYCLLSFVDNPTCQFTISAFAGTRWPLSLFDTTVLIRDCQFEVSFTNQSSISSDGENVVGTGEKVETAMWDFGNGETSNQYHGTTVYSEPGTYTVQLVSTIARGACSDTLEKEIVLAFPDVNPRIEGPTERCFSDADDTLHLIEAYTWEGWEDSLLYIHPEVDTTYSLSITDSNGCSHVLQHTVVVHPVYQLTSVETICEGSVYTFGDTVFGNDTVVTHQLLSAAGCDSSHTLQLTVAQHTTFTLYDTVGEADLPYQFLDTLLYDTVHDLEFVTTNAQGCDSTIHLWLAIEWTPKQSITDSTVCANMLPVLWNGIEASSEGTYDVLLSGSHGEDSTATLQLAVAPIYNDTILATVCDNEHYTFESIDYNRDTILTVSLSTTDYGCDSIRTLSLAVRATTQGDTLAEVCDSLVWYGNVFYADTVSQHQFTNVAQCDSTLSLHLTVHYSTSSNVFDTVLENDLPVAILGQTIHNDTTGCILHTTNAVGCDSTVIYSLYVWRNTGTSLDSTVCADQLPLEWNGVVFDTSQSPATLVRSALFTAESGADSLVVMHLTVNPLFDNHTYSEICDNQEYTFGDSLMLGTDGSTVFTDSLLSIYGCDSLSTLHLTVHPTYSISDYDTLCSNSSYTWGNPLREVYATLWNDPGQEATATDLTITDTLVSAHGCDSLSSMLLHIKPAYRQVDSVAICDDTSYLFAGLELYNDTVIETDRQTVVDGCDSVHIMVLDVHPTYDMHLYDTIFDGDRYPFEGMTCTATGDYPALLSSIHGCDSLRTLHLKVNPRTPLDSIVCINHMPIVWNGITFDTAGTYDADGSARLTTGIRTGNMITLTDSIRLTGREGLDSLVLMVVSVYDTSATLDSLVACDSLTWQDGTTYHHSTTTPYVTLVNAANCDSVVHLQLTVNSTHYYIDTREACDSMQWVDNRWYYDDTLGTAGPLGSHHATGPVDTLATAQGCDSVVSLHLTIHRASLHVEADTFCIGQTYQWRGHTVDGTPTGNLHTTVDYHLADTLLSSHYCDSILAIDLTRMGRPLVQFDYRVDCLEKTYTLQATATLDRGNKPYLRWSSYPYDNHLEGHEEETTLQVSPQGPYTTYYTYTDYHESPLCPATDSIRLRPVVVPKASLKVVPERLDYDNLEYDAYDQTHEAPYAASPDSAGQWSRRWMLDMSTIPESGPHISGSYPDADLDSLLISLCVFNGLCADTAHHNLIMFHNTIFAPNVFTPLEESNNRFVIYTHHVADAELFIYNRDGLLMYRTTDLDTGWDGRNRSGAVCPQGNYVWKLRYSTTEQPTRYKVEVGSVLLLK